MQSLDDILVGDKERIKQGVRSFLEENTEDISLAYLLKAMVKAGRIKASIRYMTFHRAIEQFSQRHYGHDIPQKRYGEIKDITLTSPQRGNSYIKAKRIIDRWTDYFYQERVIGKLGYPANFFLQTPVVNRLVILSYK